MEEEIKKGKLNKLENRLYQRGGPAILDNTPNQNREESQKEEVDTMGINWNDPKEGSFDSLVNKFSSVAKKKNSFVRKFFIFSIFFFLISLGIFFFIFLEGLNSVSSKNVDIKISGPIAVAGGQESSFDIIIDNQNNTDLKNVKLRVEYPSGTRSGDLANELVRENFSLKDIGSNDSLSQNIKIALFGEQNNVKQFRIYLEYNISNSSALFYKEKIHEVVISSSPVIVIPIYPKEVNSGQEISFNVDINSNSKEKINNFLIDVKYPFGFVFKSANPKPSEGDNIWYFDNITQAQKKTISIKGVLNGQDGEERVFRINTGTSDKENKFDIKVPFSEFVESIIIKKPFIGLDIFIDGDRDDAVVSGGREIITQFNILNNLNYKLFNITAEVYFSGGSFNESYIYPYNDGFFESLKDFIFWDKRSVSEFGNLNPGESKELSFRLKPNTYSEVPVGKKPEIEMIFIIKGERVLESGSVEQVTTTEKRRMILASDISISAGSYRSVGNIENTGPIPPKQDKNTTYTVLWSIGGVVNQLSNVEVRAILPSYVKWTGVKNPSSEILNFNSDTKEIVWNVGSIIGGVGSRRQVYFQLDFLPSSSQINTAPVILKEAFLSGLDKVTGLRVNVKSGEVTTNFFNDSIFKIGDEKVSN